MMNMVEVKAMVDEFLAEQKAVKIVPHYYIRKGRVLERSYPDYIYSDRYHELMQILESKDAKVFKCEQCGEYHSYFDLENWLCDFEKDEYLCRLCYEEEMGEDL